MPGWPWHVFDTSLVFMQVFEEVTTLIVTASSSGESADSEAGMRNLRIVRMMRVLRTLRIIRILRVVRFIAELRKVLYLIIASMWSFVWTGVLLMLLIYILAIFYTQVVADHWVINSASVAEGEPLNVYFGATITSCHSLFKAITGGVDWEVLATPLIGHISPLLGWIFVVYVAFAMLVLLNLVTGVFVDGAIRLSKMDKQRELLKRVKRVFKHTDVDDSGSITQDEFDREFYNKDLQELFNIIEVNHDLAKNLFTLLDVDGSGDLTAHEFASAAVALPAPVKTIDFLVVTNQWNTALKSIQEQLLDLRGVLGGTKTVQECQDPEMPPQLALYTTSKPNRSSRVSSKGTV